MEVVIERSPPKLKATGSTISPDIDQSSILSLSVHPGLLYELGIFSLPFRAVPHQNSSAPIIRQPWTFGSSAKAVRDSAEPKAKKARSHAAALEAAKQAAANCTAKPHPPAAGQISSKHGGVRI